MITGEDAKITLEQINEKEVQLIGMILNDVNLHNEDVDKVRSNGYFVIDGIHLGLETVRVLLRGI